MPNTFSEAALWQIIHCYWPSREPNDSAAVDTWVAKIADATRGTSKHITVVEFDEFLGDHDEILRAAAAGSPNSMIQRSR